MSHQPAWVRFDSDHVMMYAEYDGTSDQILTPLYVTAEARNAAWRDGEHRECSCVLGDEPAQYAEWYGDGSHGPIRACRHCRAITDTTAFDPRGEGYASGPNRGLPAWSP